MLLAINNFVRRQTADSPFSYWDGDWDSLLALVLHHWDNRQPGYAEGIWEIPVPAAGFYSGVVEVTPDTILTASFVQRAAGEDFHVRVLGERSFKAAAKTVKVIVYSHAALAATNSASTDAPFEVVSINASISQGAEPMTPLAMARNMLEKAGGTKATYTAEQFAAAIWYWSDKVMSA